MKKEGEIIEMKNLNRILDNINVKNIGEKGVTSFKNNDMIIGNSVSSNFLHFNQNMMKIVGLATINYTNGVSNSLLDTSANIQNNIFNLGFGGLNVLKYINKQQFQQQNTLFKNDYFVLGKELALNITTLPLIAMKTMVERSKSLFYLKNPATSNFLENLHNKAVDIPQNYSNLYNLNQYSNNQLDKNSQLVNGVNNIKNIIEMTKNTDINRDNLKLNNNLSNNFNLILANKELKMNNLYIDYLSQDNINKLEQNKQHTLKYLHSIINKPKDIQQHIKVSKSMEI